MHFMRGSVLLLFSLSILSLVSGCSSSEDKPAAVSPTTNADSQPKIKQEVQTAKAKVGSDAEFADLSKTVRGSEKWKLIYKRRTSIERSNKREKIDYKLESGRHRSTMMWYMRVYGIMICQHMDAWYVSQQAEWDSLRSVICPSAA